MIDYCLVGDVAKQVAKVEFSLDILRKSNITD